MILNNVYILYVKYGQTKVGLFLKYSIISGELYLDSVSNLLYCHVSQRLIKPIN